MLIPFGILSAAGAGGAVAGGPAYDLLETTILGSATSSVTFSSLATYASDYKHLQLRMVTRVDQVNDQIRLRFNGDTGSNYADHNLYGNGSSLFSQALTSQTGIQFARTAYSSMTANSFSGIVLDVLDAYSTTKNTTIRALSGMTGGANNLQLYSGFYNNTAAVSSINIYIGATNLVAGSRFSLYGIR